MDEARCWRLVDDAWSAIGGSEISAVLASGGVPDADELVRVYGEVVAALGARLAALPLDEARAVVGQHRAWVNELDRDRLPTWMYDRDDEAIAVAPLLGEGFHRRVVAEPDAAAVLERARGLAAIGGWKVLAAPVRERWRAALLAAIPDAFAEVGYPGDAAVASGDWSTIEECRFFCGQDWRTIDRSAMYGRASDVFFLEPAGLHYLLPAFLMAALEDVDGSKTCGDTIANQLQFKLSRGYMRACVRLMTTGQRAVVGDALRFESERWTFRPWADPDRDLEVALAQLDTSKPSPRRPYRK